MCLPSQAPRAPPIPRLHSQAPRAPPRSLGRDSRQVEPPQSRISQAGSGLKNSAQGPSRSVWPVKGQGLASSCNRAWAQVLPWAPGPPKQASSESIPVCLDLGCRKRSLPGRRRARCPGKPPPSGPGPSHLQDSAATWAGGRGPCAAQVRPSGLCPLLLPAPARPSQHRPPRSSNRVQEAKADICLTSVHTRWGLGPGPVSQPEVTLPTPRGRGRRWEQPHTA